MQNDGFSRRVFFRNVSLASTGALASLPGIARGDAGDPAPEPAWPVTVESYPLVEPGKTTGVGRFKLTTLDNMPAAYQEKLRAYAPDMEFTLCRDDAQFRKEVAEANVIYGWFSREHLQSARQLRWIQWPAAGVENILYPELVDSPIVLTNMQRMYSPTISETAIGLILTLTRGLNRYTN